MRRVVDVLFAAAVLILSVPVLIVIALAVAIDSPGNPFYIAPRIGRSGVPFGMWKFRTMVKHAALCGPPITGRNDVRVTCVGRFLRATKLDELPQFINVLLGQMTLVGPRPEAPEIVSLYTPQQAQVLSAKPGITGRNQLHGDEAESIPEGAKADEYYVQHLLDHKIRCDLNYLRHRTVSSDVQVLYATAVLVLRALLRLQAPLRSQAILSPHGGVGSHSTDYERQR
jgi:lipopolysaccharide/colanic/teichoic acid biosynthesis glycosyltransferase